MARLTKEFQQFDNAMTTILRADPKAVKAAMAAEKQANAEKRKAKKEAKNHDHGKTE